MRVLIVSEDPAERRRAASALHLHDDVEVVEAGAGPDAAAHLRDRTFDVLVVDGDLRPKGGFSWLYELRQHARLDGVQRPPAVVMVAREEDRWLAAWAGAEVVLRKPIDGFDMLREVVALAGAAPVAPA